MLITRPGSPQVAIVESRVSNISFSKSFYIIFKLYLPFKYLIYIIFCLFRLLKRLTEPHKIKMWVGNLGHLIYLLISVGLSSKINSLVVKILNTLKWSFTTHLLRLFINYLLALILPFVQSSGQDDPLCAKDSPIFSLFR